MCGVHGRAQLIEHTSGHEQIDQFRVELSSTSVGDRPACVVERALVLVRAAVRNHIERVGDRDEARRQGNRRSS
jgi:hypothetical protein